MTTLAKILISILLSILCFSCNVPFNGIKGQGEVLKKEKTIHQNFDAVKVSRGIHVILLSNDDKKVTIEANQNLHEHIKVYVESNTLYVTADENIYFADKKNVYVSYTKLYKVHVNSGASVSSKEAIVQKDLDLTATSGADLKLKINAQTLHTAVTSGALIDLEGKVKNHTAKATSGADLRADELVSLVSEAKAISGASIKIHAKNEFTGKATSGGNIVYFGNPKKVSEVDNSGGNIKRH